VLAMDKTTTLIREFCRRGTEQGRLRALLQLRRQLDPFCEFEIARCSTKVALESGPEATLPTGILEPV
jgi:hypothetical protein